MSIAAETPAPQKVWASLDQARRNAAYDNNAAVANSAMLIEARNAGSAAYRKAHPGSLDIPYAKSVRTAFDLYPAPHPNAPCLVFIHGGYWLRNSRELFAAYGEGLAVAGWSVAMPGYTLAPQASLTAIVEEIGAALDWLADKGSAHGVAGPVVLAGWSAGAQLAALHLGHRRVAAGLAISGVYDLAPLRDTALNDALKLTDREIATLSPVLSPPDSPKPLAIAYGTRELPALVHDSLQLHALRSAAHLPGPLLPIAGADHFTILEQLRQPGGELVRAAQRLIGDLSH
ncbi:MAG TPA: alpha/beta hydrolase [Roseiarcus sp.]